MSADAVAGPARLGIEQEFEVWRGGERLDFRDLIHSLPIDGLRLDPGDLNAYRLPSGMSLTCDEAEAELASPPVELAQGFGALLRRYAAEARATLGELLPAGCEVRGYSTHISISVPGPANAARAEAYAKRFGPLFGLLVDKRDSRGIYVRPRPGRLELCGEFVEGRRLEAVAAFAAGTVLALRAGHTAPELAVELLPCEERFGFRVLRTATGRDLYEAGRSAEVALAAGGSRGVQSLLDQAWALGRQALEGHAGPEDLRALGEVVAGLAPLGVEAGAETPDASSPLPESEHGLLVRGWRVGDSVLRPVLATWDFAVFRADRGRERRFVLAPAQQLAAMRGRLEGESLDQLFARPAGGLFHAAQTREAGVFGSVTRTPGDLLSEELPAGAMGPGGEATRAAGKQSRAKSRARPNKLVPLAPVIDERPETLVVPPPPAVPPEPGTQSGGRPLIQKPWAIAALAAGLAAVAVAVAGAIVISSHGESQPPTPPPTATLTAAAAAASATPTVRATETPRATATRTEPPNATASATNSPGAAATAPANATSVPTSRPTETAQPGETVPPSPSATTTPTVRATETPRPPTATATPSPRPTATATPTLIISVPPPTKCVPMPGVICP